ncbi:hypothetical protein C6P45_003877 [Maudiozyma exigua]|uniref:AMP-activated protein kinase glycogen-binding domain-containing protein n=1 Tax=Maudiozyma exigua TaxID=34358 RepID=A0A9P6WCI6_MAUEX|nr:hypothetical protein C6P45_003877 [Kazachstania exigua]
MCDTTLLQIPVNVLQERLVKIIDISSNPIIMIAGEFNNWDQNSMTFQLSKKDNVYFVDLPKIKRQNSFVFKLYIPDVIWFTVPYFDTVTDETGNVNNILYYEPEDEEIKDIQSVLSVEHESIDFVEIESIDELSIGEEIGDIGTISPNQITDSIYGSTIGDYYNLEETPQESVTRTLSQSSRQLGSSQSLSGMFSLAFRFRRYFGK